MSDNKGETVKELGEAADMSMDEFLRTLVAQMFENDNDTVFLKTELEATDKTTSTLEFQIRVLSVNGVETEAAKEIRAEKEAQNAEAK